MLRSAYEIEDGAVLDCDVCIIGAGAAGLALAHELAGSRLRVVVLTGGGPRERRRTQALYAGTVLDPAHHPWAHKYRVRRYGGTTNIWGGRCLKLDAIDYEARDYVPDSGWPFGPATLEPYYQRAAAYCEIGAPEFTAAAALPDQPAPLVPGLDSEAILSSTIERFSRPTDFGTLLRRNLAAAPRVTVLMDAHCTGLEGSPHAHSAGSQAPGSQPSGVQAPGGQMIAAALCATFRPSRFRVTARHYVLAAGGIESTRLLLAAGAAESGRITLPSPWLGRGYMCHLIGTVGLARFSVPPETVQFGYHRTPDGIYCRRRLWVTPQEQRRRRMMNVIFRLHHAPINDPAHGDPVLSAMYLVKDFILYEYSRRMRAERSWRQTLGHMRNVAARPAGLARFAATWVRYRNLSARQLPSVVLYSKAATYALEFQSEQAPDPASQIRLSDTTDAFGTPQATIDWRCNALDVASVREGYLALQQTMEQRGVGTLELDEAALDGAIRRDGAVGGHNIGTLRMASTPARGVVDPQARVFGLANCSVASAAVMPTSGTANPTFTITALAIRLADRLRAELDATPPASAARADAARQPVAA
jgi:choline dehydrogenase-like flavoprotein